jgi:uncharacterized protein YpuA (DUF1002 family)
MLSKTQNPRKTKKTMEDIAGNFMINLVEQRISLLLSSMAAYENIKSDSK